MNDYETIRDTGHFDDFNTKHGFHPFEALAGSRLPAGTLTSGSDDWYHVRKFSLEEMKKHEFGRSAMEGFIMEDIQECLHGLQLVQDTPGHLEGYFYPALTHSVWYMLTGRMQNASEKAKLKEIILETTPAFFSPNGSLLWCYYTVARLLPEFSGLTGLRKAMAGLLSESRQFATCPVHARCSSLYRDRRRRGNPPSHPSRGR